MTIIKNILLKDLEELEDCNNRFLYDPETQTYSPDGWLAYKAGVPTTLMSNWPLLWGSMLSRTARYYGCSLRTFARLSFWMRKLMGGRYEPERIKAQAVKAIKEFRYVD